MADDRMKIKLLVDGLTLPITIDREEEEIYRRAAKKVEVLINSYRQKYDRQIPKEIILTMVAFHLSFYKEHLELLDDFRPMTDKLTELDGELRDYLAEEIMIRGIDDPE